jgi:hypothetical protein
MSEDKTPTAAHSGNLPHARYRRFEGLREYEAVIDRLIPKAERTIRIFDRALSRAYNSPQRHEALRHFLQASRTNRLLIVVHDAGPIVRDCPRMMELLRQFGPAVRIHETLRVAKHVYDPFVVFDTIHYVHRFHYDHLRAAESNNDLAGAQILLDRFAEIWEASAQAVSASTGGL